MDRQDFDTYARVKTFNLSIAGAWRQAFEDAIGRTGRPHEHIRFLDQGCGDGKYFQYLVNAGLSPDNIHGVEVSRLRVERCRAIGWEHAIYIEKGSKLPYPDNYFDVANLMEVIEHIPRSHIGGVLDEIRRVLRPDGTLIVSTPNYPVKRVYDVCDALLHGKWSRFRDDPTHVSFYTHRRLRRLLERYFERVEARCFKPGFLHRRIPVKATMHKMLFLSSGKR